MSQEICGDCKHYNRLTPWAGTCAVDGHGTSPGVRCEIERFEPHGAMALDKPLGSYPKAMLRSELFTIEIGTGKRTPLPPTPVEVLAVVGLWAMVRNAEAPPSYQEWWMGARVDTSQPYVVQAVLLDYGSGEQ
jgi:hypothetical protein